MKSSIVKKYIVCLLLLSHTAWAQKDKHVISIPSHYPAGFCSSLFGVINHLIWATHNDKTPVVYWDEYSLYYQPEGYNGATNVWEYYFEPVSSASYDPAHDQLFRNYTNPESKGIDAYHRHFSIDYRKSINKIIQRYIRIKPTIQAKIDTFYEYKIQSKKTIGLHLRGTDKEIEVDAASPFELFRRASQWAAEHGNNCQFFVATDEEKLLALAKELLPGPVLSWNSRRSKNKRPTHLTNDDYSPAKKGEEVLIEAQLLSKCDVLIHGHSCVSYAALFFNPDLEDILIESKKFVIGPLYAKTVDNPCSYKAGLFSSLFSVIANAKWCDEHQRIPVIYWDEYSPFFDKNYGDNAWNYFFEPLSAECYEKGETIHIGINAIDEFEIEHPCHHSNEYRHFIHGLMNKYVRIKPNILSIADAFYTQKIAAKPTIGIHLRGTDRCQSSLSASPAELIAAANEAAKEFENPQFYVATDDQELFEYACKTLNGPVLYINAQRSLDGKALHRSSAEYNKHNLGVEALVDALLLSRCDKLVHSHSNLSYAVTFFNPDIDDIFLEHMPTKKGDAA